MERDIVILSVSLTANQRAYIITWREPDGNVSHNTATFDYRAWIAGYRAGLGLEELQRQTCAVPPEGPLQPYRFSSEGTTDH